MILDGLGRAAKEILADWPRARDRFVKVMPHEYRRALAEAQREPAAQATTATA